MKCFSFFLAFLIFILFIPPALAIGPGTGGSKIQVDDEVVGPYILLVATSPLPVTTAQQMSVWVRVIDQATKSLQREATIMIEATPQNGGPTLTAQATHKNAGNDFDYVAHFDITETGQWEIKVIVDDELGQVDISFAERVTRGANTTLLIAIGIPFVLLAFVIGVYFWQRSGTSLGG